MKYIIFPSELLDEVPEERLKELHLSPNKSNDGNKVVMKTIHFELLFPDRVKHISTLYGEEDSIVQSVYPYEVFDYDQIRDALSNKDWYGDITA